MTSKWTVTPGATRPSRSTSASTKTLFKSVAMSGATLEDALASCERVVIIEVGAWGRSADITIAKVTGRRVPNHPLDGVNGLGFFVFGITLSGPASAFSPNVRNDRIGRENHAADADIR